MGLGEERGVLFSDADITGPLDAVLLLKRTGTLIGAWTRKPADLDVLCVMTATLLGSVDTMVQALRCDTPRTLRMETDQCQLLAVRLGSSAVLVLIAPLSMREADLRRSARALSDKFGGSALVHARRTPPVPEAEVPAPTPRRNPLPPRRT